MKAVYIEKFGGLDALKMGELPKPIPQDDEILIEVAYASVNPVDWKIREGYLQCILPHEFPLILGWDVAGKVIALGKNTVGLHIGENVYAYCRKPVVKWGCYAEYVAAIADAVAPMPKNLTFAQASAIPLTGLTAWQALFGFAAIKRDQTILIHAGAGGVGGLAVQFAKSIGAKVLTTAGRENHGYVKELGADVAIDYKNEPFDVAVRKLYPQGVDVIFDCVGGEVLDKSFSIVKKGGVLVSIVSTPDEAKAYALGIRSGYVFVAPNGRELREISALIEAGSVRAPAIHEMPLLEAAEAHRQNEDRHTRGKIVLKIR